MKVKVKTFCLKSEKKKKNLFLGPRQQVAPVTVTNRGELLGPFVTSQEADFKDVCGFFVCLLPERSQEKSFSCQVTTRKRRQKCLLNNEQKSRGSVFRLTSGAPTRSSFKLLHYFTTSQASSDKNAVLADGAEKMRFVFPT